MSSAFKSLLVVLGLLPVALVGAAACGGSAFETRSGGAGSNGLAGASSTGGSATGSGGSSAGAAQGVGGQGSGRAGSTSGGTGSTGSAGSGGTDLSACTSNTQCKVILATCCSCGMPGRFEDYVAINSAYENKLDQRCGGVACAPCPPGGVDPGLDNPSLYYVATCQRPAEAAPDAPGHCVVVDLHQTEITACKSASDCTLRSGTGCCSGCGGLPVAINGNQGSGLSDLVCPSEPIGCPACAPLFDGFHAVCSDGHCGVEETL